MYMETFVFFSANWVQMKKGKGIQGLLLQQARHRKRLPDKDKHELKNQYACHMSQTEFAELRSWIEPESEQYRTGVVFIQIQPPQLHGSNQ